MKKDRRLTFALGGTSATLFVASTTSFPHTTLPLSSDKSCPGLFACEIPLQRWPIINLLPVISSCGSGYQPSHHHQHVSKKLRSSIVLTPWPACDPNLVAFALRREVCDCRCYPPRVRTSVRNCGVVRHCVTYRSFV